MKRLLPVLMGFAVVTAFCSFSSFVGARGYDGHVVPLQSPIHIKAVLGSSASCSSFFNNKARLNLKYEVVRNKKNSTIFRGTGGIRGGKFFFQAQAPVTAGGALGRFEVRFNSTRVTKGSAEESIVLGGISDNNPKLYFGKVYQQNSKFFSGAEERATLLSRSYGLITRKDLLARNWSDDFRVKGTTTIEGERYLVVEGEFWLMSREAPDKNTDGSFEADIRWDGYYLVHIRTGFVKQYFAELSGNFMFVGGSKSVNGTEKWDCEIKAPLVAAKKSSSTSGSVDIRNRLLKLKELEEEGLISKEDAARKRRELLDKL